MKRFVAFLLLLTITLSVAACKTKPESYNLSDAVQGNVVMGLTPDSKTLTDFAVRLFKESDTTDGNTLISPLSAICALAMTANGAEGDTLSQLETALGVDRVTLNKMLVNYVDSLPGADKYKLSLANSVWLKDDSNLSVLPDFLQTTADYFDSDVYKAPFDNTTLDAVNSWVKDNTDGMIKEIIEEIPDDAVMYLVNALAFDAEWYDVYNDSQISEGNFTTSLGTVQNVEYMYSSEDAFLCDQHATGFVKYYADKKYAFAALVPNENVSISEYVDFLSGNHLHGLLSYPTYTEVNVAMPKFETEYSIDLRDVLKSMGVTDAFDGELADFSSMATSTRGNIYLNRVLHKTRISVDERGTKAGAATVVETYDTYSAAPTEPKNVRLDRPFVYLLFDCETKIPFFVGKVTDIKGTDTPVKEERTEVDYGARYIRTNGGYEHRKLPDTAIINSKTELFDYYENNKNTFNLERVEKVYSDTTIGFLDVCDEYDDTFFENNSLVCVVLAETSGSIRHEITDVSKVTRAGESNLDITVKRITPDVGTDDMAAWHLIAEVPKSTVADAPEITLKFK